MKMISTGSAQRIGLALALILSPIASATDGAQKEILLVMSRGYGLNYLLLQDEIDQFGWHATRAALTDTIPVCTPFAAPRGAVPLPADRLIADISDVTAYDCVAILAATQYADGNPFADLMGDRHTMNLVRAAAAEGIPIFATCAGVRLLAAADLIAGKPVMGSPHFEKEYTDAGATYKGKDCSPIIADGIITSARGQYNNVANAMAIATAIEQRESRRDAIKPPAATIIRASRADDFTGEALWVRTYGGAWADGAQAMCSTPDGNFLIAGYTFSHGAGDADLLLICVDEEGDLLWSQRHGGSGTEYAYGCLAVPEGYLVTGYTTSTGAGSKDLWLLKVDHRGHEVWSHTYGGASWEVGKAIAATVDGYAIAGLTRSLGAGENDAFVLRTDTAGREIWSYAYGGDKDDMATAIVTAPGGGFLIAGTTASFGASNTDAYLVRLDSQGKELWSKTHAARGPAGHGFDWCSAMGGRRDGSALLTGYSDCNDLMDAVVICVDGQGEEEWSQAFGDRFYDYGTAVHEMRDGCMIAVGATKTPAGNNDLTVTQLDATGQILWRRVIGGSGQEWATDTAEAKNGDCLIVGHTSSAGMGSFDICLCRIAR